MNDKNLNKNKENQREINDNNNQNQFSQSGIYPVSYTHLTLPTTPYV